MFEIELAAEAIKDLKKLRAFDKKQVIEAIERQLTHEPLKPARNKKVLMNLEPPWEAVPPIWELRVGQFRIFYDVNAEAYCVYVRAIRIKPLGKTTGEIL